jgi:transposase InsO family protein
LIHANLSISGYRVAALLDGLAQAHSLPTAIVMDYGPENLSDAMFEWSHQLGVQLCFIQLGNPIQNAYTERSSVGFATRVQMTLSSKACPRLAVQLRPGASTTVAAGSIAHWAYLSPPAFIACLTSLFNNKLNDTDSSQV